MRQYYNSWGNQKRKYKLRCFYKIAILLCAGNVYTRLCFSFRLWACCEKPMPLQAVRAVSVARNKQENSKSGMIFLISPLFCL